MNRRLSCALLAASGLVAPQFAMAATTEREAALEARLEALEAQMQQLRADLAQAREAQANDKAQAEQAIAAVSTQNTEVATKVAAVEKEQKKDGFTVGSTTFKMGGFVKVNATATRYDSGEVGTASLGEEFYYPQQIPIGNGPASEDFTATARQTRLWFSGSAPVGDKEIKGYVEFDFAISTAPAGAQRATNPYAPNLRRAFIQYDKWLIGQEWSTFENVAVLPETTDFVGTTEGTVFNRQPMIRYTTKLKPGLALALALENPETEAIAVAGNSFTDYDDDILPDFVARLDLASGKSSFSLAGVARQLRTQVAGDTNTAFGWGVSGAGKIVFGPGGRHDLRFMATYGQGVGRYLGLGYVADAAQSADGSLEAVENLAAFAALKLGLGGTVRSTIMGSYQTAYYPDGFLVGTLANKTAWSAAANLFWSPASRFDVGVEYRHGVRETVSGVDGALDRMEFAAKYSF